MVGVTTAERDLPLFLCVTLIDIGVEEHTYEFQLYRDCR